MILSLTELDLIECLASAYTIKETAQELDISYAKARRRLIELAAKMNARNLAELYIIAADWMEQNPTTG